MLLLLLLLQDNGYQEGDTLNRKEFEVCSSSQWCCQSRLRCLRPCAFIACAMNCMLGLASPSMKRVRTPPPPLQMPREQGSGSMCMDMHAPVPVPVTGLD
jgi:hypothetical protein